jgi:hypothetical protein
MPSEIQSRAGTGLAVALVATMTIAALASPSDFGDGFPPEITEQGWYWKDLMDIRTPRWRAAHPGVCPQAFDLTTASEMVENRILGLQFDCSRGNIFSVVVQVSPEVLP